MELIEFLDWVSAKALVKQGKLKELDLIDYGYIDGVGYGIKRIHTNFYYQALKNYIKDHNIRITGSMYCKSFVPVFSDGNVILVSGILWGKLMAKIWNDLENTKKYFFTDFYLS
ncbi:MAG: hypothetical protein GF311_28125 [Candidatus Lokiarchaeota archaeon]|nr:hypothetical protein [Candidatus Lokiarchaeota archaeon]